MVAPFVLSRARLLTFMTSPRLFQQRYVLENPEPQPPLPPEAALAARRGKQFHQLLAQLFSGVPDVAPPADTEVRAWWRAFQEKGPRLPAGVRLPEISLTVPVGGHFLTGRFDLLVHSPAEDGAGSLHIYDWKTERRPRDRNALRLDWQTRLYLALATAGGQALIDGTTPFPPSAIRLTYWFTAAPHAPVTLDYDEASHRRAWEAITGVVAAIDGLLRENPPIWPDAGPATADGVVFPPEPAEPPPMPDALEPEWS